jgi:hypothetical protein
MVPEAIINKRKEHAKMEYGKYRRKDKGRKGNKKGIEANGITTTC